MSYLVLENGAIINTEQIVSDKDYVPMFADGKIEKIKIITKCESLELAKQRLIEYCSRKPKSLIALWVKQAKKRITFEPIQSDIILNKNITKEHLIIQLVKYNEKYLLHNFIK